MYLRDRRKPFLSCLKKAVVNLKELSNVKELIDTSLEKLAFIIEVLEDELRDFEPESGRDGLGGESLGEGPDVEDVPDPLVDARIAAVHAYDVLASVLDVTEPHRKRYEASRAPVARSGNTPGNTPGNTVASVERQTTLPRTTSVLKENSNGENATTRRIAYKKSKPARS